MKISTILIATFILLGTIASAQDSTKMEYAKPAYSLDAIKSYFKSSETSHLSSKEQSWSFSYMSSDKKKLQKFADELNKGAKKPKTLELRNGKFVFTLKERAKYNAETLFNRIQELNKIATGFGVDTITSFYVDTLN